MRNKMKRAAAVLFAVTALGACAKKEASQSARDGERAVLLAAAASLKNVFEKDLIPRFKAESGITVDGVYDSSGRLQTQITQGLEADVFFSAAMTQMNALVSGGYVNAGEVVPLLQNRLVLIKRLGAQTPVTGFENISAARTVAIGAPDSVPAGAYAKEALAALGVWDTLFTKSTVSEGTNVTEVLNWVAAGSAEAGIVYATDAASNGNVEVIAVLKDGILAQPVIYPAAPLAKAAHKAEAAKLLDFLRSDAAAAIFEEYGFSKNK
ncbi:MAG: molybdate ABC transporter substrate-binding protein [Spirochaetaceae bacterium]|jgi:molybdate transport system substrate-binding protein|nr:molybdate ABC transporter substrate-binding protein [Spirochaetaceae bacterium]